MAFKVIILLVFVAVAVNAAPQSGYYQKYQQYHDIKPIFEYQEEDKQVEQKKVEPKKVETKKEEPKKEEPKKEEPKKEEHKKEDHKKEEHKKEEHKKEEHHHEEEQYDYHPQYKFHYKVEDKKHHDFHGHQEHRDKDLTVGEYWLVEPDGHKRYVKYRVDKKSGFVAEVHREPIHHH